MLGSRHGAVLLNFPSLCFASYSVIAPAHCGSLTFRGDGPWQMLWESKFDGTQQTAGMDEHTRLEIYNSGWVFWSIPQQIHINMV